MLNVVKHLLSDWRIEEDPSLSLRITPFLDFRVPLSSEAEERVTKRSDGRVSRLLNFSQSPLLWRGLG